MIKINLFTLTWNAEEKLTKLKNSLFPALEGLNYTWHIKDNASKDNTVKVAQSWGDNVNVIAYKNNLQNFSEGMNLLFKEANPDDEDYIMLLNNDVIFNDTTSIKNMIDLMDKDQDIGVVGAKLLFTGTNKLQHAGVVFVPGSKTPTHFRAGQQSDYHAERNREFQVVTGAVLLTKAKYYKNIHTNADGTQGLDHKLVWAFDDVDACMSIKINQKKKIVYCGQTNIFHEESASLKKNPVNLMFMKQNVSYFTNKWADKYNVDIYDYTENKKLGLYK